MDNAAWLAEQVPDDLTPLQRNLALAEMRDRAADAADERDEAQKEAARQDRREALLFLNHQVGNPLGELSRAQAALAEADDLRRDALDQLRKADRKVANAKSGIAFWSGRLEPVSAPAQRSIPGLGDVGERDRELRLEAARMAVERRLAAAPSPAPVARRSHPKEMDGCAVCVAIRANDADEVERLMVESGEITRIASGGGSGQLGTLTGERVW
jgi:hypothetical protein